MRCLLIAIFAILILRIDSHLVQDNFKTLAYWRDLVFKFPSPHHEAEAVATGKYVPGNSVPIDVDVHYKAETSKSRVFVTIPRFTTGIPFTLAQITHGQQREPALVPYPSYQWHSSHGRDCSGLTSVFRIAIDECQRMWVSDTGRIGTTQYCAPSLKVFDLNTDQLIHSYEYPRDQYKYGVSLFVTPVVDVRDPPPRGICADVMVYTADVTGFGLLVYDTKLNKSWRIENRLMYPVPRYGIHTIAGESFELMDGILGMAISPRVTNSQMGSFGGFGGFGGFAGGYGYLQHNYAMDYHHQSRKLFFHALASVTENAVPLRLIDNATIWESSVNAMSDAFRILGNRPTQSAAEAIDSNGNMFFGLYDPISIACWNIDTPFSSENIHIVARNDATLQFASSVKVIRNSDGEEELWIITCRFQKVMAGTKSANEVNFRVQGVKIRELLGGSTRCSSALRTRDNLIN